ncbi:MAG: putative bifunctional diguanylate cyclase/phosphodiesterase [Geminicoccaceae bacterium]
MQTIEDLREILADLQHENYRLKTSAEHAELLMSCIEELLVIGSGIDPFAIAFGSIGKIMPHDVVLVLVEDGADLLCVSASDRHRVGQCHAVEGVLKKALSGRVVASLSGARSALDPERGRSALYLPIQAPNKRGVVVLLRDEPSAGFGRSDVALGQRFALLANQALAIRSHVQTEEANRRLTELSQQLERQAYYDDLTNLPNRTKIQEILDELLRDNGGETPFAMIFMDVNKFKQINDYFGHEIGDKLLISIARRISNLVGPGDCIGRISGDEFLMILTSVTKRPALDLALDRIADAVSGEYRISGFAIHASVSMGVSRFPDDGCDQATLRRNADGAMYRAKAEPGSTVAYFDASMADDLTAKMQLEGQLRRAIQTGSFVPIYQPKINIRTGCVTGFEMLLRWVDDERILQPPGRFLAVAEELGLLNKIMTIAVAKIVEALPALDRRFGSRSTMSINIAAEQATNLVFVTELLEILRDADSLDRFIFEITEDQALNVDAFTAVVQPVLRENGIRIAIDDFGQGFSSLSNLSSIDVHELKIDRAFVSGVHANPAKQRVLRMIELFAEGADMVTVAEGVETDEELRHLMECSSIEIVQGFLFSPPRDLESLLSWDLNSSLPLETDLPSLQSRQPLLVSLREF